ERARRPGARIVEQGAHQLMVHPVPGAAAVEMPEDRAAGQIKVPDRIEHLVADELVRIAQPPPLEYALALPDDGVVEPGAASEARCAQRIDLVEEAEGARPADIGFEGAVGELHAPALTRDRGARIVDLEAERQALAGLQGRHAVAIADGDGLEHADAAAR